VLSDDGVNPEWAETCADEIMHWVERDTADQLRAVEALRELRGKGRVHFGGCPWPITHCTCKKAQAILAALGGHS
jgi:hypothetical protein